MFAKRDATQNLRYKFGEDLRAENPDLALLFVTINTVVDMLYFRVDPRVRLK